MTTVENVNDVAVLELQQALQMCRPVKGNLEKRPQETGGAVEGAHNGAATRQRDQEEMRRRRAKAQHKFSLRRTRQDASSPHNGSAATTKSKLTPLEQQVVAIKKANPGVILLVEVGYKFRFFDEDARIAAQELNIYCFPDHNFMTASIPIHRLHVYVRRLVKKGHKVGIVRQGETAALKAASAGRNSVFQRKLTAVYTPSTLEVGTSEDVGADLAERGPEDDPADLSSYLMCVCEPAAAGADGEAADQRDGRRGDVAFVAMDPSTSDIVWGQCADYVTQNTLESALLYINPKELLVLGSLSRPASRLVKAFMAKSEGTCTENVAEKRVAPGTSRLQAILALYGDRKHENDTFVDSLSQAPPGVLQALHALFDYLQGFGLLVWNESGAVLRPISEPGHMQLTGNAMTQLHVLAAEDGSRAASLLHLVDCTLSPLGARLMQRWVSKPLIHMDAITERQDAVAELASPAQAALLGALQGVLQQMPDLERAIGRAFHGRANPAEFAMLMRTLSTLPSSLGITSKPDAGAECASATLLVSSISSACAPAVSTAATQLLSYIDESAAARNDLVAVCACEARFPEVFRCRADLQAALQALQALLPKLAKVAGVPALKYTSIQNQGDHLIELPVDCKVPSGWTKVCSTKKCHRYHPPEVKEAIHKKDMAAELLEAESKRAWASVLEEFAPHSCTFRAATAALATLDCLQSLATVAQRPAYCRPNFVDDSCPAQISIRQGRAPVLDALLPSGAVPNDVDIHSDGLRALVINGPNMGGKSCFMRQVAQIVLLAQIGSWVPAQHVKLRVVDSILTRMGASDNILQGRSTFLEELLDASEMLKRATDSSLLILDELGRGTATHDGVAIAIATLEHILHVKRSMCLFVTHYPEVCAAADALRPAAQCFHMAHLRQGNWDLGHSHTRTSVSASPSGGELEQSRGSRTALQNNGAGGGDDAVAVGDGGSGERDAHLLSDSTNRGRQSASVSGEAGKNDGGGKSVAFEAVDAGAVEHAMPAAAADPEVPRIVFLYKLQPGAADQSFGLNVAVLAGVPARVVKKAAIVAAQLASTSRHVGTEDGGGETERSEGGDQSKASKASVGGVPDEVASVVAETLTCLEDAATTPENLLRDLALRASSVAGGL